MGKHVNEDEYKLKLRNLDDRQDSIQSVAQWILSHCDDSTCSFLVSFWLSTFRSVTSDTKRLNMLYVANDVIQNCKRNKVPQLRSEFAKVLKQAFLACRSNSFTTSIGHIVDIWDDRGMFRKEFCADLRAIIKYNRHDKGSQSKGKRKQDTRPVMQVKPMPKQQAIEVDDEFKSHPKDLFDLETTTAVLKKCTKRRRQFDKQFVNVNEASNVIDRLTSYGASDETVFKLFTSVEDMKTQIDTAKQYLEDFVETLTKKVKYDSYAIKCMSRAEFYYKDQFKLRKDAMKKNYQLTATPLKLQAWVKARKSMLQSNSLYPVIFSKSEQQTSIRKPEPPVKPNLLSIKDLETISDSSGPEEEEDEEYSPPRIDGDMCSPPPLSRGVTINESQSDTVDSLSEMQSGHSKYVGSNYSSSNGHANVVSSASSHYQVSHTALMTPSMSMPTNMMPMNFQTNISTLTPISSSTGVMPPPTNPIPNAGIIPVGTIMPTSVPNISPTNPGYLLSPRTPVASQKTESTHVNSAMLTPTSISPSSSVNSPPQPPMTPFMPPSLSSFMFGQMSNPPVSTFSTPPVMPTAPPIPFPPPANFPPPPFPPPFLPPSALPAVVSMTSNVSVSSSNVFPSPGFPVSTSNAVSSQSESITINADVHAALNSLLSGSS